MASVKALYETKPRPGALRPGWVGGYDQFAAGFPHDVVSAWGDFWEDHASQLAGIVDFDDVTDPDELWSKFFSSPDDVKFVVAPDGSFWAYEADNAGQELALSYDQPAGKWRYTWGRADEIPDDVRKLANGG